MGKHARKVEAKVKARQADFDSMRNTKGFHRPGSRNLKKQGVSSSAKGGRRR